MRAKCKTRLHRNRIVDVDHLVYVGSITALDQQFYERHRGRHIVFAPDVRMVVQDVEALEHGVFVQVLTSPTIDQLGQPLRPPTIPRGTVCLVVKPFDLGKDDLHPKVAHGLFHVIRHGDSILVSKGKGSLRERAQTKERCEARSRPSPMLLETCREGAAC